jgi:hypothetical protein
MASYNPPIQNVPEFDVNNFKTKSQLTLEDANNIYVRFPTAQSDIKLQNTIIENNLIQNDELTIDDTSDRILITDANKNVVSSNISSSTLSFLQGLTGNIQDQLDEKPIVYWNNTGEQIIDPVILVGTAPVVADQPSSFSLISLDTPIKRTIRTELILPLDSNSTDRPVIYSTADTNLRTDNQLYFRSQRFASGPSTIITGINCLYIVIGEPSV